MIDLLKQLFNPFLLISLLIGLIYYYFTATFEYWESQGVPFRKPKIFVGNFGQLLLFKKSQCEGILEMYNWFKSERFFGVFRVRSPALFLRDPELIKRVCVKDFAIFTNRGIPVNNSQDPLNGHLFNLEGRKWKSLRSKLTPTFSSGKIKRMFYLLAECSDEFEKMINHSLTGHEPVEVRELAAKFTIDVIGSCAFGIQINALHNEDSAFRIMATKLSKPSYRKALWRMLRTSMPTLFKILRVQVIDTEVTKFFKNVVSEMIKEREEQGIHRHDFMDLLIELKNKGTLDIENVNGGTQPLTEEDIQAAKEIELDENGIAAQAFVFFAAGYETASATISFCLHELALNPEIQEMTKQDIRDNIEEHDGKLTFECVSNMKYLDKVVLETLRKHPPAPMLSRRCEVAYQVPETKVVLPPGTRVIIPIYALHHDPEHYPEPEIFDPERFSEKVRRTRHPFTFLPFGEGPRNCIGMRFALLQTKVGIISLLKNHWVNLCDKSAVPMKYSRRSLVTTSENGIWLQFNPEK
ncbi:cytochrome P450 6a2-like [Athalia rosae]|uniref:cytochrome P450 6a2-like n=1 Tax=Athalia rosae TaxID=37344 RepID=UPI002033DF0A|nr:cytochrome P450 6a2-like [Athalia rosae]